MKTRYIMTSTNNDESWQGIKDKECAMKTPIELATPFFSKRMI
jgi:hypothetical protein